MKASWCTMASTTYSGILRNGEGFHHDLRWKVHSVGFSERPGVPEMHHDLFNKKWGAYNFHPVRDVPKALLPLTSMIFRSTELSKSLREEGTAHWLHWTRPWRPPLGALTVKIEFTAVSLKNRLALNFFSLGSPGKVEQRFQHGSVAVCGSGLWNQPVSQSHIALTKQSVGQVIDELHGGVWSQSGLMLIMVSWL